MEELSVYQTSTVADNCEMRAQSRITIVFVGVEMDHSSGSEPGREATLTPVEQLHWVRHGNEYETAVLSGDPEQPGSFYVMTLPGADSL